MSWQIASWLLFGGSTLLMLLGLPVAFSFLAINIIGAILFLGGEPGLIQLARNSVDSVASFSLTPIPMFVLMGEVLFHTGLAVKVVDAVERLITKVPGRLAVVAVVAGTIFSAISGSTIAVTAMLGSLMVPLMIKRGYHPIMATGPIIAVGALDMLMPVSALTVLLGSLSGISIPRLLMGGFVPGMILKAAFIAYIVVRVKLNPSLAPTTQLAAYQGWEKLKPLVKYVIPILSIFLVVVASMSFGFGTPTESAAIGALATVVLALAYRALTRENLLTALRGTMAISGMILFIIVGATTFSQILSFSGASNGIVSLIVGHGLTKNVIIADMMLGRGTSSRDRAIIKSKVAALARKGPGGWWRIAKNAARYQLRMQERPVSMDTWIAMLTRSGFAEVTATSIVAEAGLVTGHRPERAEPA